MHEGPTTRIGGISIDHDGLIAESVACHRCGYDLRGIRADGDCPECAGDARRSLEFGLLHYADPDWLQRVRRGLRIVFWGILVNFGFNMVIGILAGAAGALMSVTTAPGGGNATGEGPTPAGQASGAQAIGALAFDLITSAGAIIAAGIQILIFWGIWLATSPDPGESATEPALSARTLHRWSSLVLVATVPVGFIVTRNFQGPLFSGTWTTPTGFMLVLMILASIINQGVLLTARVSGCWYGAHLYRRLPDGGAVGQFKTAGIGLALGYFAYLVSAVMLMIVHSGNQATNFAALGPWMALGGITSCVGSAFVLGFGAWAMVLLWRLGDGVGRALETARAG